ncbi:hypothetical protein [Actinacidiphila sp. ITFR-21]|uniref:hypothetical protein n=1 Tax=Actinacidiphila sp. ITFR-21 TaxID=3075199 RepID=UPI0028895854|nr:hypothetical protein [Streptomyces sp. ITFR-21]WNI19161.1 hypothetical protein RLT57_28900 [Streptomyces sp. ITFR-21]
MSDWIDRLIADGLARAGNLFEQEQDLGRQMWSVNGWRGYLRRTDTGSTLTIRRPGRALGYEIVGVDLDVLT